MVDDLKMGSLSELADLEKKKLSNGHTASRGKVSEMLPQDRKL